MHCCVNSAMRLKPSHSRRRHSMFFEIKKSSAPVQGLLAIKVEAAKKKIASAPRKPQKRVRPKRT